MKGEILNFILSNKLNPFNNSKTYISSKTNSIYKTRDAKAIHAKVLNKVSSGFIFSETSNLWSVFEFIDNIGEIIRRQEFFKSISVKDNSFLLELEKPRRTWKPRYDIVAVTEEESTFVKLKELGCNAQLLVSEKDVLELERYDIVQVVDCIDFSILLERLPQTVFVDSVENAYLERYLEELSGWRDNFNILRKTESSVEMRGLLAELEPMFNLLNNKEGRIITEEEVEKILEDVNEKISKEVKKMTISGEGLMEMLGEGKMPQPILEVVRGSIEKSGLNEHIFNMQIPVTIDYKELEDQIKRQSANEFTSLAERVKKSAEELKDIPRILKELSALLLIEDFCRGVNQWIDEGKSYPTHSENLHFSDAENIFLNKAQPISFQLDRFSRCSILTGANSGGKTTLLEHALQNISLFQLGLPMKGEVHLPIFSDVYYFAKNKGSASKGAFETLLTQMSKIKPGTRTLILADEIEAVTEPGVAGKIISATADFFIKQNCFIVLATHLGAEISKKLPEGARIDGIEAKGLDEQFNLIVDHNPILGKLAHSTPELIVERMANTYSEDYFKHLHESLKKD
jgi:DNA mismatch repair protein MutS2